MAKKLPEDNKLSKMPKVKTAKVDDKDESETWDSTKEKTSSKYLYDVNSGKKVSVDKAYSGKGKNKTIKPQYKSFVTDTIASGKIGSGKTAKKAAETVEDTIKNGQERNAVKADYAFASPEVKESLAKNTKASQKVVDEQAESIKKGEGFEGSKKVLTGTEEGKKFASGISDEEKVEEETPEIPATLEDSLNTAENSESVRNQLDKYGVHDPSNQGEMEQAKVEAQNDTKENIGEGTSTAADAKNKEEFDSILEQNKKEIEEATKVSGWFNVASVLEVLSLVACVFTGGAVPFVPFTRFGGIQSYVDNNAKLQARASAIQGQTDALTEQNRALRQEETKYKSALANEEARKQLKDRIKSEHPDWTDEQIESDVNRILKQQAETSEDIQKEKAMSQIRLDEKDHTTPDEIMNYIRQLNQEKIQIDNAIKAVQSDDIDKAAQLYGSLIGTFSVLSSSTVNNTSGHTFGAGIGGETGNITSLIAKANGNINYGYNTGSQAGSTNLSREGVQVADALKAEYKNNTKAVKQQMIADLEEAKREIDQHIAEYKQSYQKQTGRSLDDSDCRKKHTYVPKDKRSTMVKSDQLAKHTYIPSNKRSTQEGIGSYNGVAVNWKKKNKEAENNGTENTEAVQKEE